ncbi:Xaa-Pro aminopeptidase [Malonomonas rubra DSM 5091]|uniref:Xaa-Pro aminopeptidase n=2 Tax=Malonomonas rubra TaxID=57040 RepID=A0A1M6C316_MALRU|nr:Xaa-Pro peptidase family protein [Malonomonas rubra]SHI55406.1 Xaa-Pro aminopeptidase [Malonomonas rubra DSM 5091]
MKEECQARIACLQERLQQAELDGAFILYPIDIYYYSATRQNAALWVPTQGDPMLMVRKSLARAEQESGLDQLRPFPRSKDFASLFDGNKKIGMTFDVLPVDQYNFYQKMLPQAEFVDISMINRELRSVKSDWELERMRHGGVQLSRAFATIADLLKPGMREIDLAAEFESVLRKIGGEGLVRMRAFNQEMFMGLVVSGRSGSKGGFFDGAVTGQGMSNAVPFGASTKTIEPGQPVLIDYAGVFDGYIVDMTRMFVCGELDAQLQNAFDVSCRIQDCVAAELKPGAICSELFERSLKMAEEAGLDGCYMGPPGEQARFVGHGVGLELDEFPVLAQGFDMPLIAGQTIAIEPKFVFPKQGPIGIENTYVVTQQGGEKISVLSDALISV